MDSLSDAAVFVFSIRCWYLFSTILYIFSVSFLFIFPIRSFGAFIRIAYYFFTDGGVSVFLFYRSIIEQEGPKALFRGLGPNLVGVAPSRAIYFCAYSQTKKYLNTYLPTDTAGVHIISASIAGKIFVTSFTYTGCALLFSRFKWFNRLLYNEN